MQSVCLGRISRNLIWHRKDEEFAICLVDDIKQKEYIKSTSVMLTWLYQEIVIRKITPHKTATHNT